MPGDVLIIQNARTEGPGSLAPMLADDGFDAVVADARQGKIPTGDFGLVVILGGPESANDGLPYLRQEQDIIRDCVRRDIPVLGICLGSQLIARALGGRVCRGPAEEIGFYDDLEVCGNPGLFRGFGRTFDAFHWHGETFDLPEGATRLVSSETYENQAFECGSAVGLQFHLEVDAAMVGLWLDSNKEALQKIPHVSPGNIRADTAGGIPPIRSNMKKFYANLKLSFRL